MSVATLVCPYCGLPRWRRVEKVLSNTRRYLIVSVCQCENCGKMFYICRTSMCTFTVKFEEVSQEELIGKTRQTQSRRKSRKGVRRRAQRTTKSQQEETASNSVKDAEKENR